jgi:hypothetical protein
VPHELSTAKLRFRLTRSSGGADPSARALKYGVALSLRIVRGLQDGVLGWEKVFFQDGCIHRGRRTDKSVCATRLWEGSSVSMPHDHGNVEARLCQTRLAGSNSAFGFRKAAAEQILQPAL